MASTKKPSVEVGDGHFPGRVPGPDGNTSFVTGKASVDYTYTITNKSIDWETTFAELGKEIQNFGDGLALAGYGFTVTGVGAGVGVPLAGSGNVISLGGSLLESAATSNFQQGATSVGFFALDIGTDALIRKIPGTAWSTDILLQNKSLKLKLIEKTINSQQ